MSIQASRTGRSLLHRVSPVRADLSLATPPMSPVTSLGTLVPCLPCRTIRWAIFSSFSSRTFHATVSEVTLPLTTLMSETLPVNGSLMVLKTSALSAPSSSQGIASGSPPRSCPGKLPRFVGLGSRSVMASRRLEVPIPWAPETTASGKILRADTA